MATPNRWPPWIEPRAGMSVATQDITTATGTALTGVTTATLTPHIRTRVLVTAQVRVNCTAYAGQFLFLRIMESVSGGAAAAVAHASWDPLAAGVRIALHLETTRDLTKETSYLYYVDALLSAAGASTYQVLGTSLAGSTGIVVVGMPNLHS